MDRRELALLLPVLKQRFFSRFSFAVTVTFASDEAASLRLSVYHQGWFMSSEMGKSRSFELLHTILS
jgi:hypothetical protein